MSWPRGSRQSSRRRLTGHGCRLAQGYLFSRPQAAEIVEPLLLPSPRAALDAAPHDAIPAD